MQAPAGRSGRHLQTSGRGPERHTHSTGPLRANTPYPICRRGRGETCPSHHVGATRAATAKSRWAVSWGPTVPHPESVYSREVQATTGRR